jgi:hypothetical protein
MLRPGQSVLVRDFKVRQGRTETVEVVLADVADNSVALVLADSLIRGPEQRSSA